MAKNKIERIDQEITKVRGKIIRRPAGRENSRAAREIFLFNAGPVCYNFIVYAWGNPEHPHIFELI